MEWMTLESLAIFQYLHCTVELQKSIIHICPHFSFDVTAIYAPVPLSCRILCFSLDFCQISLLLLSLFLQDALFGLFSWCIHPSFPNFLPADGCMLYLSVFNIFLKSLCISWNQRFGFPFFLQYLMDKSLQVHPRNPSIKG